MSDKEESQQSGQEEQQEAEGEAAPAESNEGEVAASTESSEGVSVHFGNLAFEVTEEKLKEVCSKYGEVLDTRIPKKDNGRSKGYGFVRMKTKEAAQTVIDNLNNTELEGRTAKVDFSTPTARRPRRDSYDDRRDRRYRRDRDDYYDRRDRDRRYDDRDRRYDDRRRRDYDDYDDRRYDRRDYDDRRRRY